MGGRWETGLLWRENSLRFPDTKDNAIKRLQGLERRLDQDPIFAKLYYAEMDRLLGK